MQLERVGLYDDLAAGDIIRMVITPRKWLGATIGSYLSAYQIYRAERDSRFDIQGIEYNGETSVTIMIEVQPTIPGDPYAGDIQRAGVSPWLIAVAILGASIAFVSVTTYKVTDVIGDVIADPDNPIAQDLSSGVKIMALAAVLFGVYLIKR